MDYSTIHVHTKQLLFDYTLNGGSNFCGTRVAQWLVAADMINEINIEERKFLN